MTSKATYAAISAETVSDPTTVMVEVTAPATLKAGYTFRATYDGTVFPVVVPEGGVVEGQKIVVPFDPTASYAAGTTISGAWKDDLCACTRYGICHPSFINAIFCPLILLGQIMTRLKLSWKATETSEETELKKTFKVMVYVSIIYWTISFFFSPDDVDVDDDGDDDRDGASPFYNLFSFAYGVFVLITMMRVRKFVREKYQIPEQRCIGCEDCCCSFWCTCCTASQLARQTADYDVEEAYFFSNDGLAQNTMTPVLTV